MAVKPQKSTANLQSTQTDDLSYPNTDRIAVQTMVPSRSRSVPMFLDRPCPCTVLKLHTDQSSEIGQIAALARLGRYGL